MNKRVGGLILLSLIPMLGGLMRLRGLSIGDATMDGHARFAADPIPAVLHIIGATSFATLGALQFLPSLRRNAWHRLVGRVISALGIVAMLAGTWMILTWPHKPLDSAYLSFFRVTAALAMAGFIAFSVREARRGAIDSHARWTRAYAIGAAGGTQAFTLAPMAFSESLQTAPINAALFTLGFLINLAVAEWVVRPAPATLEVVS